MTEPMDAARSVLDAFAAALPPDVVSALERIRAHGVPACVLTAPAHAGDERWRRAVEDSSHRAERIARARVIVAEAVGSLPGLALSDGVLGPAWSADVDVYVEPEAVAAAGAALLAAGALAVDPVQRRLSGGEEAPPRHFALVDGGGVLAPVELVDRLWSGGPAAGPAIARAEVREGTRHLGAADVAARRTAKAAEARRPTVRALAELTELVERGTPLPRRLARAALARHATLEHELMGPGPVRAAVAGQPWRPGAGWLWLRARVRGARSVMRPRRGQLRVAFVGVDGAGKSTQATRLAANLRRAGVPTEAIWARLGNRALAPVATMAKLAQRLLPPGSHSFEATREAAGRTDPEADPAAIAIPLSRRGPVGWSWALAVTLDYVARTRVDHRRGRGRVLVLDRALPDALVALEDNYGVALSLGLQRRLLERWVPAPDLVIYLRLPGTVAKARKDDTFTAAELEIQRERYERLLAGLGERVVVLDAQRSRSEIAAAALTATIAAAQESARPGRP